MSSPVLLFYGAGRNVGVSVLNKFAAKGWKTAAVVRTMKDEYKKIADVVLQADFADYKTMQSVYNDVESKLGTPNCVVYNAFSVAGEKRAVPVPFHYDTESFALDMAINTTSLHAAASAAVMGFAKLSAGPKVFIYTGNALPTISLPDLPGLGAGKAASANLIEGAAHVLKDDSHWYFADERFSDGFPVGPAISGEAAAETYFELATAKKQGPWNYTFSKEKGYVKCDDVVDHKYVRAADMFKRAREMQEARA